MKKRNFLYGMSYGLLLLCFITTGAFAQGRVSAYTVQTPSLEWNDLQYSENASYVYDELFFYSSVSSLITLPFDFKYDNTTKPSGTSLDVGPGWISFGGTDPQYYVQWQDQSSYPGIIYFWAGGYNPSYGYGYVTAGSGEDPGYPYYGIYTEVDGAAPNRVFTIQESYVHMSFGTGYSDNGTSYLCSMQIKLYEGTGVIQYLYQNNGQYMGGSGTAGIGLNGFGSPSFSGLVYQQGTDYTPSTDLQFTPPAPPQELSLHSQGTAFNFGSTNPQNPITMCVTAKSVGGPGSTLHITGAALTGSSYFTQVSGPPVGTAMPVGTSVQYCFQFLPFSDGSFNATFTLTTDGVDSGTQHISLSGAGAVPTVSYSSNAMFRGVGVEVTDTSGVQYLYVNAITPPGGGPLTVNSVGFIGIDAADYFVTHLPGPIQPGGVDSIGVRFAPRIEGQPDAHMVVNTNATNIPWDTVGLYGVGILPHLAIDSGKSFPLPTTINFDSVKLGTDTCIQITLTNPGSDTIAIEKNYFQSADYDFSITPITGRDTLIAPGGSQQIQVCFTPLQQGHREAVIRILTNIPHTETTPPQDTSSFIVNIIGIGVPTGKLMLTGSTKKDSAFIGKTVTVTDTFWNTGDAALTVTTVNISGTNAGDFTAHYPTLPFTIASNSNQPFTVSATPSVLGAETALLTATGTSSETPVSTTLVLGVFGESNADTAIVAQPFLAESCGSDTEIITITNQGNLPETYQGSIPSNPNFTLLGSGTTPLTPGGGVDTFKVMFTPTSSSPVTGTLNFVSSGSALPSITLTASGGAAVITGSGNAPMTFPGQTSAAFPVTITNNGSCPWTPGAGQTVSDLAFTYQSGGTTPIAGSGGTAVEMFTYSPTIPGGDNGSVSFPGATGTASSINVTITAGTDDVSATSSNGFSLEQNYPNPFNETSQCEITLPVACVVHLSVINVEGQVVQTLLNQHYDAGSFEVTLDASGLASGTYYYQMTAGNVTLTKQMVILK